MSAMSRCIRSKLAIGHVEIVILPAILPDRQAGKATAGSLAILILADEYVTSRLSNDSDASLNALEQRGRRNVERLRPQHELQHVQAALAQLDARDDRVGHVEPFGQLTLRQSGILSRSNEHGAHFLPVTPECFGESASHAATVAEIFVCTQNVCSMDKPRERSVPTPAAQMLRAQIGSLLQKQRLRLGMTQAELAERTDLSLKYIGEIERGAANSTLDVIALVAETLHLSSEDLMKAAQEPLSEGVRALLVDQTLEIRQRLGAMLMWLQALAPALPPKRQQPERQPSNGDHARRARRIGRPSKRRSHG
jgi:transcriptional regulator with XRE-family HTH domain